MRNELIGMLLNQTTPTNFLHTATLYVYSLDIQCKCISIYTTSFSVFEWHHKHMCFTGRNDAYT